jgi:hypothetical protein
MKKSITAFLIICICFVAANAFAGRCDHADDYASDGSRCGGRAADQKPGGR